jgi:hypothetical protein
MVSQLPEAVNVAEPWEGVNRPSRGTSARRAWRPASRSASAAATLSRPSWASSIERNRIHRAGTAEAVESSRMSPVLKTAAGESSEEKELDFELAYQRSLTTAQRFEMMIARSRQIAEELIRRGHRKPVEVAKRP